MQFLDEIPEGVADVRDGRGRPRSQLRTVLETMAPGDILETDVPASKKAATRVRAMVHSMKSDLSFSVLQGGETIIVQCWYDKEMRGE